ncbi:MAG: 4Fe-4S dicluster domain-containing protein [Candidatus Eisenbacteria bacterium]
MLFDASLCVGCESCVEACREKNGLPETDGTQLSADRFSILQEEGDYYLRRQCLHCLEPSCVSVCPVAALQKKPEGPVTYDFDRCIGCRYCMVACPFGVPRYEWSSAMPRVRKCQMCYDRLCDGQQPACAEACPTGATLFGDRDELLAEARKRVANDPDTYANHIFGEKEAGGTSFLVIGPPEVMAAFDPRVPDEALPEKPGPCFRRFPRPWGSPAPPSWACTGSSGAG